MIASRRQSPRPAMSCPSSCVELGDTAARRSGALRKVSLLTAPRRNLDYLQSVPVPELLERTGFDEQIKCSSKSPSARSPRGIRMGPSGLSDGNVPAAYGG